jgi:uncharacterized protein YggT (Ycf19 family)
VSGNPFFVYWYYHIPNYVLALLMYTMLGRLALSFAFPADSQNYIWRAFVRITDPALAFVRWITPAAVPYLIALVFATLWLMVVRVLWYVVMAGLGLAPTAPQ